MDLCLIAAGAFSWLSPSSWLAIMQVCLGLGAVIFVHELGHFLVAKACGVKCEKFYLGFDAFDIKIGHRVIIPRSLLKWQWGETVYGIGILPLGGYVKMLGQDDNPANTAKERERSQLTGDAASEGSPQLGDAEAATDTSGPLDRSQLDPRSYQAKTVLQRMAIISAGVIMNLIFAVLFATWAFWYGVPYMPPVIGQTMPGGPAYQANLGNSEVLAVDDLSTQTEYFPFEYLQESILLNGGKQPVHFRLRPVGQEATREVTVTPQLGLIPQRADFAALGFGNLLSTTLGKTPTVPGTAANLAQPALGDGDRIVAVDGSPVQSLAQVNRFFAQHPAQPVTLTVERRSSPRQSAPPERIEVIVPPNPYLDYGIQLAIGPIAAIQDGSPAASSGLRVGDRLLQVDGAEVGDPLTLEFRLLAAAEAHREVTLTVARGSETAAVETLQIQCGTRLPEFSSWGFELQNVALDSLGIAIPLTNVVAGVASDSPAHRAGIQSGDRLVGAEFQLPPDLQKDPIYRAAQGKIDFAKDHVGWANVVNLAQSIRPPQPVELLYERGDSTQPLSAKLIPVPSPTTFLDDDRGLSFAPLEQTYRAPNLAAAFRLGLDRTRRDMGRVIKFLGKLVSGEIGVKNLGGPGTIAVAATSEATYSLSRLLLFLTLLSANLAIVNFLPIPVLDGGHMVFLAYEGIFRKPVNERVQLVLMYAGLLFIVGLMLLVISLDIFRFVF